MAKAIGDFLDDFVATPPFGFFASPMPSGPGAQEQAMMVQTMLDQRLFANQGHLELEIVALKARLSFLEQQLTGWTAKKPNP